ncbi:hypothetical protein BU17DRAFT_73969 [Hysterangium stoloniferum]|nr:hypothetical protein BU17DRAFT_73969 [Hysterangium stoloniferum]
MYSIRNNPTSWNEQKLEANSGGDVEEPNPVIESSRVVYKYTRIVKINEEGVRAAARYIYSKILKDGYSPHIWREHPLHLPPPQIYVPDDPRTKACLDWIFLISSLNFSFWSQKEGTAEESGRFGVEWREGWASSKKKVWTGYWSLLAAVNKALEANIPITDPVFYCSKQRCPDSLLEDVFRPAACCVESIPLLTERIAVMREVGSVLVSKFGGSYAGLLSYFLVKYSGEGTALQLVQMMVDFFPSFRDEAKFRGRKVQFWKRAQILVAETWAAFYPPPSSLDPHPFFPKGIGQLTMFAGEYEISSVPQILHHLHILTYPPSLCSLLKSHALLPPVCRAELSIRAASILAVEAVRDEIARLQRTTELQNNGHEDVPSVLIDFFLWDLAKKLERGEEQIDGIVTAQIVPAHRTRSIWY